MALTHFLLIDGDALLYVRIALIVGMLLVSLSIHEWAHAWVAHKLGDDTAKSLGRMTPNPIVHIDPLMTIALPVFLLVVSNGMYTFGGAKPVPVDPRNFKNPLAANALVAIAGPLSNIVLMFVFLAAYYVSIEVGEYRRDELLPLVLLTSAGMNAVLAVFNMIPLPPLDGSRVAILALPPAARMTYAALERYGILIVMVLIWYTPLKTVMVQTASTLLQWASSPIEYAGRAFGLW